VSSGWQRERLWEGKRAHAEGGVGGGRGQFRAVVGCVPRLGAEQAGFHTGSTDTELRGETLQTLDAVYRCGVALITALLTVQGAEGVTGVSGRVGRPVGPAVRAGVSGAAGGFGDRVDERGLNRAEKVCALVAWDWGCMRTRHPPS
jgi:hypothetical protein